jgi:hypothetical protein
MQIILHLHHLIYIIMYHKIFLNHQKDNFLGHFVHLNKILVLSKVHHKHRNQFLINVVNNNNNSNNNNNNNLQVFVVLNHLMKFLQNNNDDLIILNIKLNMFKKNG